MAVLFFLAAAPPILFGTGPATTAGGPDDTGISIARLSLALKSFAPDSGPEFERALEHTKGHEQSTERMAAVLAGEKSLFEAEKLRGQEKLDFLERAARAGDAAAAEALGERLDLGDGLAADPRRAFGYSRAAALGGRMEAAHNTGAAYATSRGVPRDFGEALAWLIVAHERGDPSGAAEQLRGHLLAHQRPEVIAAAEQRATELRTKRARPEIAATLPPPASLEFIPETSTEAKMDAGDFSVVEDADTPPTPPDVVVFTVTGKRLAWATLAELQRAAFRDEAPALGALGRLLVAGKLLPADPLRAAVLLERSAAQGDVDAAHQLGDLYSGGEKIVRDDTKAFTYFLQAAQGGSLLAMVNVGVCFTNGRGTVRDYAKGLAWLTVAKHYGVDPGQESRLRAFLAQHAAGDLVKAGELSAALIREVDARRGKVK